MSSPLPPADPEPGGDPPPEAVPGAGTRRSRLDAAGRERPVFLLDYPEDPELERLVAAFEAGNYALVRRDAPALAEKTTDPAIKAAALELRERIEPDPLAKYLLFVSALLLVLLTIWAYRTAAH
jgi:hypothetical protein